MGLSGFLYVAIVVGWAVYLVPYALKRYDEAARNRSIDRFSSAMRVLGRHGEPAADLDAHGVSANEVDDVELARGRARPAADSPAQRAAARAAARTAARRRRRVLVLLMFATAAVATAAWFLLVPMWSVAVPATLLLLWLFLCPIQARRERRSRAARSRRADAVPSRRLPVAEADEVAEAAQVGEDAQETPAPSPVPAPGEESAQEVQVGARPVDADVVASGDEEPTVVLDRTGEMADEDAAVGSGSLWDPVPVTLPTYVHKPRAPRTIRTIDLGSVGVQSSARSDDAARGSQAQPADAAAGSGAAEDAATEESQPTSARAVGE